MFVNAVQDIGDGKSCLLADDRRLAAIVFADIVGYSLLMAADERGTYDTLDGDAAERGAPGGRAAFGTHRGPCG